MYGLIHKAARFYVLSNHGETVWDKIADKVGLENRHFLSALHFDDSVTMALIDGIADVLCVSVDEALRLVGKSFPTFTLNEGYGRVFDMAGADLSEFIQNLDRMHSSLKISLRKALMPSFTFMSDRGNSIFVLYQSPRGGLDAFVQGILEGMAEHYGESAKVVFRPTGRGTVFMVTRISTRNVTDLSDLSESQPTATAAENVCYD